MSCITYMSYTAENIGFADNASKYTSRALGMVKAMDLTRDLLSCFWLDSEMYNSKSTGPQYPFSNDKPITENL
jgi:hypothetical protein